MNIHSTLEATRGMSDTLEIQRRAFEAQFGSLESMGFEDKTKQVQESESDESNISNESDEESQDDSEGLSQEEEEEEEEEKEEALNQKPKQHQPRVIKFRGPTDEYTPISKKEQRLLRSGKPLRQEKSQDQAQESQELSDDEENLKNDIELQRFLKESHLLSALGNGNTDTSADSVVGKARARTLEMRLRGLSETNGKATALEKMPIQVRRGMVKKHLKRIEKHETEAREGGVVLHNVKKGHFRQIDRTHRNDIERRIGSSIKKQQQVRSKKRQRGLRIQSVGRSTRNGLRISQRDIDRINNKK